MRARSVIVCLLLLGIANPAAAVIITTGDGSGNTSAPAAPNDPGFANVGVRGTGTAVYLGYGWVITAAHVGSGWASFGGQSYNAVAGSEVQLTNGAGGSQADLLMYKLQNPPNLPPLAIIDSSPVAGWNVTMIGNGRDRQASEFGWTAGWDPAPTNPVYQGYAWSTDGYHHIRWGTNTIASANQVVAVGSYWELGFLTTFDDIHTSSEAQGAPGDSGGGVFHQDPVTGQWFLAGIMATVYSNAAGELWNVCVFGDVTESADLSYYRSQIYQTMKIPGDVNFDGTINLTDLTMVASHWLATGTGTNYPTGDANRDGIVNLLDLTYVAAHWSTPWVSPAPAGTPAPEPSTFVLAAGGVLSCWLLRRRKKRCAAPRPVAADAQCGIE